MRFRPCIDLHDGVVKQIVGATLSDTESHGLETNFQAEKPAGWFADLYRRDNLTGGHVIQLGMGNTAAARSALSQWPGGMQVGGGINADSAEQWLNAGASHIIVTSWVFHDGRIHMERLKQLTRKIGKARLVLDLSCRKHGDAYLVATNRWQAFTTEAVTYPLMDRLSNYCDEFLIHAVDVEGRCAGIEADLVAYLGRWEGLPVTYAGGISSQQDLDLIESLGNGCIDFTVGSALDIFGGTGLCYEDLARRYSAK
ncbi:MAG: phosphoribosylformimino-5-aminoimidazole carboxamide ribotide isomerase [Desulfosarcina sp.]|nr:phosphoribosylformimino-5-aminoimidazole carboxamide ribotide isomerase [Desulfosarcina sp.]MBC2765211.1 phosphoribosylformimino-5-aminoimidazole carboxamide ribotide isomerase [Desulfosarcina sp.]